MDQADIDAVRNDEELEVRFAGSVNQVFAADILGEIPVHRKCNLALSVDGGGQFAPRWLHNKNPGIRGFFPI